MLWILASTLSACAGNPECETEGRYQSSQSGRRIQAPQGLDELEANKELTIPRASPREPNQDTGRCLEYPPGL